MFEFHLTAASAANIVVSAVLIYLGVIVFTRLAGLRSFSKMSSFDFAMTVAIGSLIASTVITRGPMLLPGLLALAMIYMLQISVGKLRHRFRWAERLVDNEPRLLMDGRRILEDNLRAAGVTHDDLRAKLREANVLSLDQVRAVVMETTGDISVLHSSDPGERLDDDLLERVRR